MSGRHQPLNGADSYVPARLVAHSTANPDCFGCSRGNPCSQACAACGCRWSGDPRPAGDECSSSWPCVCHDEAAEVCTNCDTITTDIRIIDFGRGGQWSVCGTCLDKWQHDDERVAS